MSHTVPSGIASPNLSFVVIVDNGESNPCTFSPVPKYFVINGFTRQCSCLVTIVDKGSDRDLLLSFAEV